jgi:hypothetical protein
MRSMQRDGLQRCGTSIETSARTLSDVLALDLVRTCELDAMLVHRTAKRVRWCSTTSPPSA